MSLSSSLFTGTSGLKNMGNALQITGNNISNLNTVGFKKGRSTFADTLYENVATQAGTDQMGRGMAVGDVSQNFAQGSFESTGNTTDLSIGGDGFFVMRQANTENTFYTRAGNFFFDKNGQMVNPEGYVVQGWDLDEDTGDDVGAIKDLVMKAFTSPPKKSTKITAITNLDADAVSKSRVLSNSWDSGADTYMPSGKYEYQTVLKVYDTLGSTHDVSIFYDKKSGTEWEYIITSNPEEDNRNAVQGTDSKGLLARGTIQFSQSSGDILDFTMDKFTGRLGAFKSTGVNKKEDINYQILNYDEMPLDGYGFYFEFDGVSWNFANEDKSLFVDPDDLPENYKNAKIVYSDDQEIHLVMNQTDPTQTDPDLKIKFDQAAVAADTIGFDVNDKNGLHMQNVVNNSYTGDAEENNNTEFEINDPSVMTHDSAGVGLVWNPNTGGTGKWYWSNPLTANSAGTLVSGLEMTSSGGGTIAITAATMVINNASVMTMYKENVPVRYQGLDWDWNDTVKLEDFTMTPNFATTKQSTLTVAGGSEGAIATDTTGALPTLYWLGNAWSLSSAAAVTSATIGNTSMKINTAASTNQIAKFDIWYTASAGASTATYTIGDGGLSTAGGQSFSFTMDPTPPREYKNAILTNSTALTQSFSIDFNGDNKADISFIPTAGGQSADTGTHFIFDVNPDVPPPEYANAKLKGDKDKLLIDLDGSGNDSDNDDIKFTFKQNLKFGAITHPLDDSSEIHFDILGSTAWSTVNKADIEQSGYYSFTADFLGGEFGSTSTDIQLDLGTVYTGTNFVNDSLSTTQYAKSSSTVFQEANGYSAGDLQGVDVASDGILTGIYSNGQLIPLFRVGLAKFLNNYGLRNEGGNLFRETRDSGSAITNKPGENGLGTIAPNSLEMSNVDISEEFVNMIVNQRGFQANSKTITTVDDMMSTVIQMKR